MNVIQAMFSKPVYLRRIWVARDSTGALFLYHTKPKKGDKMWKVAIDADIVPLDKRMFPEVKWEDAQPTEVELVIKK